MNEKTLQYLKIAVLNYKLNYTKYEVPMSTNERRQERSYVPLSFCKSRKDVKLHKLWIKFVIIFTRQNDIILTSYVSYFLGD